jgi:hypothetical protein
MRRTVLTFLVAAAGVLGVAGLALAQHNEPAQGKKFQTTLVTPYASCTAPNNSTKTLPLPSCNAVRSNAACGFDTVAGKGKGKFKATVAGSGSTQTIKLLAQAKGLEVGCQGKTLSLVASVRATTDDCTTPPCTVLEGLTQDFPTGLSCVVDTTGACNINGTLPAGILAAGANTGLQLKGCALLEGSTHTVDCGVLYP